MDIRKLKQKNFQKRFFFKGSIYFTFVYFWNPIIMEIFSKVWLLGFFGSIIMVEQQLCHIYYAHNYATFVCLCIASHLYTGQFEQLLCFLVHKWSVLTP